MLRPLFLLSGICLAVPAAAQLPLPVNWSLTEQEAADRAFILEPLSAQGFSAERPGVLLHGFRVTPQTGTFIGYQRGNWLLGSALTQYENEYAAAAGALDIGARYGFDLNQRHSFSVSGGVRLDLSDDMGLRMPYKLAPDGGENGLGFRLSWRYSLDENRYISTTLGYDQDLGGDSYDDSRDSGASFGTYFGYRF